MTIITRRLRIEGRVQGVGYRYWTVNTARRLDLRGWVRNLPDGSVEILASGPPDRLDALHAACLQGPDHAHVERIAVTDAVDDGVARFEQR